MGWSVLLDTYFVLIDFHSKIKHLYCEKDFLNIIFLSKLYEMYIAPLNLQTQSHIIRSYIEQHGFATLVSAMGDQLHATHTPLQLVSSEGQEWLHGHVPKPIHR